MSTTPLDQFRSYFYTPHVLQSPRKHYIKDLSNLKEVATKILGFNTRQGEYKILEDYYNNITKINTRRFDDLTKPNNRIGYPFAEIITKTATSYFSGIPIQVVPTDKGREKDLKEIDILNDTDDVNSELDRLSNIYGHAFEVHWRETINGKAYPRFKAISPKNCMIFHSMDFAEKPIGAAVWSRFQDDVTKEDLYECTVYDDTTYKKFSFVPQKDNAGITEIDSGNHNVGALPVVEYLNNEERSSSYEKILGLIDSYNLVNSDTFNDIEYWADSYLVLTEMSGTDAPSIASMKSNRVLLVDGTGKAEFLNKQTNDKHLENIKDRLTSDIHKFAQVPNLHDEQFAANLSGTAIRMKIKDLEDKISAKERKFEKALRKRYEIIYGLLDMKAISQTSDFVSFKFKRNIPLNLIELAEMVSKTPEGVWSKKTMRTLFPIDYNEQAEEAQLKKEAEEATSNEMGANPFKASPNDKPMGNEPPNPPKVTDPPKSKK